MPSWKIQISAKHFDTNTKLYLTDRWSDTKNYRGLVLNDHFRSKTQLHQKPFLAKILWIISLVFNLFRHGYIIARRNRPKNYPGKVALLCHVGFKKHFLLLFPMSNQALSFVTQYSFPRLSQWCFFNNNSRITRWGLLIPTMRVLLGNDR